MKKHIVIIGHGAIGLLWGHNFHQQNHNVTLLTHREVLPKSQQTFKNINNEYCHAEFTFSKSMPENVDLILVTTKVYQVKEALSPWLDVITAPMIILHNGMGAVEDLTLDKTHQVMLATTTHGALLTENTLTHTGLGQTVIGNYQQTSPEQLTIHQTLLNNALPPVKAHPDIQHPLLLKLAINCVINPLTALNQCQNGKLQESKFQSEIDLLINELQQVIPLLEPTWHYTHQTLKETIMAVVTATANNYSSMAQDVKFKRQTEIDFINGYIVREGKRLEINMTENEKLWNQVNALPIK